ncbi:APC5 protein [Madurella fahalii]|uniref:Anaphase-promoting complex subunit 5 n=1 Tax=Madurella fahalii TaxID=1157608 RepID=A0ABQ0G2N1_9PEZI
MSRYLAPAKIGLLALIQLYVEGAVPTDAILPVINFLTSNLLDHDLTSMSARPTDRWKKADSIIKLTLSVHHFEEVLGPYPAADRLPGRRLWDRFLEKLWGIDSLHTLHEFFGHLPNLLAKTKAQLRQMAESGESPPSGVLLSRNSPLGVFVRRLNHEFSNLQFNHASELWMMFVKYRQPTAAYWRRRNPHFSRLSFDSVLMSGEHEWGPQTDELAVAAYGNMLLVDDNGAAPPVSTDDIESLLEFQIAQVQKYGSRVPADIMERFQSLLKSSRVVPSLSHYLQFSESWRSGDLPTSFDYLHRYFDYTMQNRDRLFYQYALMNLAIVQSDFGCHKEALSTMLEAVSIARENRDTVCLNFTLNWFFHFGKGHPDLVRELEDNSMLGSGKESLSFLRAKAKETGMWTLWSSSLQAEAKFGMANGESVSTALEHLVRSSQIIVERNLKSMMGTQLSLGITLWDRLGLASMSTMACEVFLRCHKLNSVFDDELKITCRLAGLLAGTGKYDEALAKLDNIDGNALRSAKSNQYWHLYRGLFKLRRNLHHNNLEAAEALLSQLLQSGPEDIDRDMLFVIDTLHIECLTRRVDLAAAYGKIEDIMAPLRGDHRDLALRIRLLLAKVHLFDRAGRPEKGFSIAVRAAGMAWRARLAPLLWQAVGALARILAALGEFAAAADLLVAVLPRCLESDTAFAAATLYNLLADAWVGLVGEMGEGGRGAAAATSAASASASASAATSAAGDGDGGELARERGRMLARAHGALDAAFKCFSAVEDVDKRCEVMAKKAALYRAEGDHVRAEECADAYLGVWQEELARKE